MQLENDCPLKLLLMSVKLKHYRPSLVDEDVMDLDDIFDQFIEPRAFENCNQLPQQDSGHNFLYSVCLLCLFICIFTDSLTVSRKKEIG